jgi:Mg2+ and Co2+ transporter CorA
MGNKADVVKGLSKRCNENWSVAPKSDICASGEGNRRGSERSVRKREETRKTTLKLTASACHSAPPPLRPQNVRRRIKQLKDYINVTSDWISYALIDDITDAFGLKLSQLLAAWDATAKKAR